MVFGKHMTRMTSSSLAAILGICAVLLSAGCTTTGTSLISSSVLVKPTQSIKEMQVLYLENTLQSSDGMSGWMLETYGYVNLPERFRERVPIVLEMNNIVSDYSTSKKADFNREKAAQYIPKWTKTNNPPSLLIMQAVDGSRSGMTFFLNIQVSLFSTSDTAAPVRLWVGQFSNTLNKKVVDSKICLDIFDNEFVDQMLKTILDQMAKDGILALPGKTATIPTTSPVNKCKYVYATLDYYEKNK